MSNPTPVLGDIVDAFLSSYILSWVLQRISVSTAGGGLLVAIACGNEFVLPLLVPDYLFSRINMRVLMIDALNAPAGLTITCGHCRRMAQELVCVRHSSKPTSA
ncbi:MAG: DUF1761 domain-containing protein [Candidatus Binatia bacterium]